MGYQVVFSKLDFQKSDPKNPTIPLGGPVTLNRGEFVPDWVPEHQINALLNAGMVVFAADPIPGLRPSTEDPAGVRTPDMPPVLPSDPNGVPPLLADRPSVKGEQPVDDELPPLPKDSDNKETWEQYAARPLIGMTLAEAEAMNKRDLMAEVKRRHAISAEPVQL